LLARGATGSFRSGMKGAERKRGRVKGKNRRGDRVARGKMEA